MKSVGVGVTQSVVVERQFNYRAKAFSNPNTKFAIIDFGIDS